MLQLIYYLIYFICLGGIAIGGYYLLNYLVTGENLHTVKCFILLYCH